MDFRRIARRIAQTLAVLVGVFGTILSLMYLHYPQVKIDSRQEELAFWKSVDALTAEDHSALINYVDRTGKLPRILPWWEMDNAMCSAAVVKYVAMLTGVKLVHSSAWTLRTARAKLIATGEPCLSCPSNATKLTTVWDKSASYGTDGKLPAGVKESFQDEVRRFLFEQNQVYVIGLLWEETTYWDQIVADVADKNSHVALWVRGKVLHFIHRESGVDPLYWESVDDLFADGKLQPVWIARVHAKGQKEGLRLPVTARELPFCQNVMPWSTMRHTLVFPRRFYLIPAAYTEGLDGLIERSLFRWVRNGYDMYPRFTASEAQCGS